MAVREMVFYPDRRLGQPTAPVTAFDQDLHVLLADMFETMHAHKGVGLAAPQVGVMQNLFVVSYESDTFAVINPEIRTSGKKVVMEEGCLSIPNVQYEVERYNQVYLMAQNEDGHFFEREADGFLARIIQHEYDHLLGRLILDYT